MAGVAKVVPVYGVRVCGLTDVHSDEGVTTVELMMFETERRIVGGVLREIRE